MPRKSLYSLCNPIILVELANFGTSEKFIGILLALVVSVVRYLSVDCE